MSINLAWLAVQGADEETLLDRIGFEVVGESSEILEGSQAMLRLPSGWVLIAGGGHRFDYQGLAPAASSLGQTLAGSMSEVVMCSTLRGYRDGAQTWAVDYDPEKHGATGPAVEGAPPAELANVSTEVRRMEADAADPEVDFLFDIPVRLLAALTGFDPNLSETGIWRMVAPRSASRAPRTDWLRQRIEAEILPWLRERGWSAPSEPPTVSHGRIVFPMARPGRVGLDLIGFRFFDDKYPFLEVLFFVGDGDPAAMRLVLYGTAFKPRPSLFKRLANWARPPTRAARLDQVVANAREELLLVERVLDGAERGPRIAFLGGAAARSWPEVPPA